jgi:serine-type D-Ala-D-Ala carboxypeptidase/endopeptidase (penicillin-binding protein 4)
MTMHRASVVILVLVLSSCSPSSDNNTKVFKGKARKGAGPSATDARRSPPTPQITPSIPEAEPPTLRPWWMRRLDRMLAKTPFSVHVRHDGEAMYSHDGRNERVPASVQKLVLSMALFEEFGSDAEFPTTLAARKFSRSRIKGDLWVIGSGDPTLGGNPAVLSGLPPGATNVQELVAALRRRGIKKVDGRVMASTDQFARDWYAPGWKPYYKTSYVGLPSALTYNVNVHKRQYTKHPERLLAENLRKRLKRAGIVVTGGFGAGPAPARLRTFASVGSPSLSALARFMNRQSSNFFAEVLGKRLGAEKFGGPGTIAKGARAVAAFARDRAVRIRARDSSGLSYDNRMSSFELASLIEHAEQEPWANHLRRGLAGGGDGTLEKRLHNVRIRAKTGTLINVSALAGWVWLAKAGDWAAFAIISRGLDKSRAISIEDAIVRTLHRSAR